MTGDWEIGWPRKNPLHFGQYRLKGVGLEKGCKRGMSSFEWVTFLLFVYFYTIKKNPEISQSLIKFDPRQVEKFWVMIWI